MGCRSLENREKKTVSPRRETPSSGEQNACRENNVFFFGGGERTKSTVAASGLKIKN